MLYHRRVPSIYHINDEGTNKLTELKDKEEAVATKRKADETIGIVPEKQNKKE